jgi:tripartite-type tricarboxylate transporter receptor subunit TctC
VLGKISFGNHAPTPHIAEARRGRHGGRVHVYFATIASSIQFIRAGRLRALAVTASERSPALLEVAAMAEFLPGYDATIWNGLNAPKGTPRAVIMELNRQVNAGLANPEIAACFAEQGARVRPGSPEDYARFVAEETEKWRAIVKSTGSQVE